MYMLHCTDCEFGQFDRNSDTGRWRGTCLRGYVLANAHIPHGPDHYFADNPEELVPVIDPQGREYLRTRAICDKYVHISEVDRAQDGRGGILRFFKRASKKK